MRVMKAAENHSRERREKMRAMEASKSTDNLFLKRLFTALMATGISPKNERAANISFAKNILKKKEAIRAMAVRTIRQISKIMDMS